MEWREGELTKTIRGRKIAEEDAATHCMHTATVRKKDMRTASRHHENDHNTLCSLSSSLSPLSPKTLQVKSK